LQAFQGRHDVTEGPTPAAPKSLRRVLYGLLEVGGAGHPAAKYFDRAMILLIALNLAAGAIETLPGITAHHQFLIDVFEIFCVTIFILEYIARLWVSAEYTMVSDNHSGLSPRLRYALTPVMLIDLVAILPSFLYLFLLPDFRVIRIFRLLRLLKFRRYSPAMSSLWRVLVAERHALSAALLIMLGMLMFSSTVIYYLERDIQPAVFGSIPQSMWWAISTLTTVGYGDAVPVTMLGRMFGGLVMIFGLGMFALPIGIMASGFSAEIHRQEFVVRWALVANVPLFSGLDASTIAVVSEVLRARTLPSGVTLARKGEKADRMFFIVSGEVERIDDHQRLRLEEGAYFGLVSLLRQKRRPATYVTRCKCELLILEAADFDYLMAVQPKLKLRVAAAAKRHEAKDFGAGSDLSDELSRDV
jgi:voltage-gated potassium channel